MTCRGVAAAYPEIVRCGRGLHGGWHSDFWIARPLVQCMEPLADFPTHTANTGFLCMSRVKGMEDQLHSTTLVLPIQLRKRIFVADQHPAGNALQSENAEMITWAVVRQIAESPVAITSTEHLVVSVNENPSTVDDIDTVMWFVLTSQTMR